MDITFDIHFSVKVCENMFGNIVCYCLLCYNSIIKLKELRT